MVTPKHARIITGALSDGSEVFDVLVEQAVYSTLFHAADQRGAEEFARWINEGRFCIADTGVTKAWVTKARESWRRSATPAARTTRRKGPSLSTVQPRGASGAARPRNTRPAASTTALPIVDDEVWTPGKR
jgi:hypothetical protein